MSQWSKFHKLDGCRECGSNRTKHWALGLCQNCYERVKKSKYRKRIKCQLAAKAMRETPVTDRSKPIDFERLAKFGDQWWLGMLTEDALEGYMKHKEANA